MKSGTNHWARFCVGKLSLVVAALAILAAAAPVSAQSGSSSNSWAMKMFSEAGGVTSRNFGDLALHSEAEQRFRFRNIYKEDVVILSAQSSCSCTNVSVPKKVIKSGEIGEIVARVDTSGKVHVGKRKVTITVHFSSPRAAEVQLHISAMIRADVVFDPGVVEFGSVSQGASVTKTVYLQYKGRLADWRLDKVTKNSPSIRAEGRPLRSEEIPPGWSRKTYKIDVQLLPAAKPGYINDLLRFTSNEPGSPTIFIPVHGQVISALSVKPTYLQFGVIHRNESTTRNLVVRGSTPFQIQSVSSDDPRIKFRTAKQESTVHVVPITLTTSANETLGEFQKKIEIKTTIAELPALDIPVFGIISDEEPISEENGSQEKAFSISSDALEEYHPVQAGPVLGGFDDLSVAEFQTANFVPVQTQIAPALDAPSPAENDLPIPAQINQKFSNRYLSAQKIEDSFLGRQAAGADASVVSFGPEERGSGESSAQETAENVSQKIGNAEPEVGEGIAIDTAEFEEDRADRSAVEVADGKEAPVSGGETPSSREEQAFAPAKPQTPFTIDPVTGTDENGWFPAANASAPQKTENKNAATPQNNPKKTAFPGRSKVAVIKSLFFKDPEVK